MSLDILPGPLLSERTTLRLGGKALAEVVLAEEADLHELDSALSKLGGRPFVLGKGSNILALDGDHDLVLIRPQVLLEGEKPWQLLREEADHVLVRVGAGAKLPGLVREFAAKGWAGLQGMAGIPGLFGGAVAMNAGSFGSETGRCLFRVQVFCPGQGVQWLEPGQWETGYRHFRIKHGDESPYFVVAAAELKLDKGIPEEITAAMLEAMDKKKATQPIQAWSAGSAFKNPGGPGSGVSAGKLLDDAGFRGFTLGGMAFSEKHANFLVNTGKGTASEAINLIAMAQDKVKDMSGHELELEVRICPCN